MNVQPYLYFNGRCEEAMDFYKAALGAEVIMMMRFSENPEPPPPGMTPPGSENKIMHASLRVGDSVLLVSDGRCSGQTKFEGISLSITAKTAEKADSLFAAICEGGQVQMPLVTTFFASRFGMAADKFGVSWMIMAPPAA